MNRTCKKRIQRVISALRGTGAAACMVVSSAPAMLRTRDQFYRHRQDSDFYYLTGIPDESLSLFISTERSTPLLIAPVVDKIKSLWDGAPAPYPELAASIGADLVVTKDVPGELRSKVKGHDVLYHQNRAGTYSEQLARALQGLPSYARGPMPAAFHHVDTILEEMRLIKDASEIKLMREAATITAQAILGTASMIKPGMQERTVACTIDYWLAMLDAGPGFETIAATGKSAATLHYSKHTQTLRKGELFLLDCGAEYKLYNADITRTFPVGGKFSPEQRVLYYIVLEAQTAAIGKIRHGARMQSVYDAAAKVLTEGLVELKVLRGTVSSLIAKKAYKPYFPHGIGHSLGIDVHDVGKHRGNNDTVLKEGMVLTVEPGLYFPKRAGRLPACGIRIEDDVHVRRGKAEILTREMPRDPDTIEVLLAE